MDEENASSIERRAILLCGKAWTAYCGSMALALLNARHQNMIRSRAID